MAEQAQVDFFTVSDRRELMKLGLQLDTVIQQMTDAKVTALATVALHDRRIGSLEVTRTRWEAQIKAYAVVGTMLAAIIGWALHFVSDWLIKH